MRYSIRCDEHITSDSRFFGEVGWFASEDDAQEAADRQTAHHAGAGLEGCTFVVRREDDRPAITRDEAIMLAGFGADLSLADPLPEDVWD